jgi:peptide-methionine (S)-S-oxide reductase
MTKTEVATLAGGCFWCLEAVYVEMEGVTGVQSGYMGGHVDHPSYEAVCTGRTGHAEVVQVTLDPEVASFRDILDVFFTIHDPTTLNRQGNDIGNQYRSAIFYHSEQQRATAEEIIRELTAERVWPDPVVTELEMASTFYPAEADHDDYYRRNPNQPYCMFVVEPKVQKFRKKHADKMRSKAS